MARVQPVDSTSVCALRLQEAGVIKRTPQTLLAQGPDWRLPNELKKELKD
jgi:NitT/TauT family transport system substrate-binding protein